MSVDPVFPTCHEMLIDHLPTPGFRCGWGTLCAFAGKNYNVDVTGITLGKNQTAFGNKRLADNGVPPAKGRILCMDYRDIPHPPGHFNKIVSLEMAEVCRIAETIGYSFADC